MSNLSPEDRLRAAGGLITRPTITTTTKAAMWTDSDDWSEAEIPRRPWIAPGYALRGAVTLVAGPPSVMKSSLMLTWAASLALGIDHGRFRPLKPESVIVYNVEDDRTEQRRRLSAVLRQFSASPSAIRGRIFRTGPTGIGTLVTRNEAGAMVDTEAFGNIKDLIETTGAGVLIVDPLAELHNVEENDNTGIRAVVAEFRALAVRHNIAVILLHHTRKGAATMAGDPDIARGASSIIGAVRVALTLTGMSEDDAKAFGLPTDHKARSNYIRLDDAKSNYSPIGDAAWFEKAVYTLENGEAVPAPVPWTPPAARVATLNDLAALATAIERGAPNGEPYSGKLSKDARSIRALLEEHGFIGADAQKATLTKLTTEMDVEPAQYRRPGNRSVASGLRIGDRPSADWLDEASE